MPIIDKFEAHADTLESSSTDIEAITPHDVNELPFVSRIIHVGGAGTIQIVPQDKAASDTAVAVVCVAGQTLLVRAVKIKQTGTTATSIVIQN